jgi:hypothetical protein
LSPERGFRRTVYGSQLVRILLLLVQKLSLTYPLYLNQKDRFLKDWLYSVLERDLLPPLLEDIKEVNNEQL